MKITWRRAWQSTPVFLPGESCGWVHGSLQFIGSHRIGQDWSGTCMLPFSLYWLCYSISSVLCFVFLAVEACGILSLQPGMEPEAPSLEGKVLTGPPGSPRNIFLKCISHGKWFFFRKNTMYKEKRGILYLWYLLNNPVHLSSLSVSLWITHSINCVLNVILNVYFLHTSVIQ